MNTTTTTDSREDDLVATIGVLVLLLGTATGNAYAMLIMAISALVVIAIFYRHQLGRNALLAITVAATASIAVVIAIARL